MQRCDFILEVGTAAGSACSALAIRSSPLARTVWRWLAASAFFALTSAPAAAQDCPTAASGQGGFVVERGDQQKSEVFHVGDGTIRTVMRYNGTTVLETTQHEGLFQLDRLDNGRRTKFEPQSDLKKLFPLKPGCNVDAKFISENNGRQVTLSVDLAVRGADALYIGPCKYNVLKIERSESRTHRTSAFRRYRLLFSGVEAHPGAGISREQWWDAYSQV
jgi:hypothetical protein